MIIQVKVQPRASLSKVVEAIDGSLKVYIKAHPTDGKANKEVCEVLAQFYKVKKSAVRIISGYTSRNKLIEIQ